jgi:chemotaxis protein histidine kinase CheA
MKSQYLDDPIFQKAYVTYLSEVKRHLFEAKEAFAPTKVLELRDLTEAKRKFHTIRGGAGFFGLEEIAKIAGEIEALLTNANRKTMKTRAKIVTLISSLEDLSIEE